ncbi:MAG TPA: Zn-ribbon containing protein [Candidatus Norongarragalinales archaeon]|jgi:hypothetical protein|nr:Zn-ribbon containing protein [Candidatus Norongarragalinales archaeon]
MAHKCVRCATVFENNSPQLLSGCSCGSRVFLFVKDTPGEAIEGEGQKFSPEEAKWLEKELEPFTAEHAVTLETDAVENVRIVEQGSYVLNIKSLMSGDPVVVKSDKGVYYLRFPALRKKVEIR